MFSAQPSTGLDGRIIGGKAVKIEDVPYQISLRNLGFHTCGGSIISSDFILTAAHCVEINIEVFYRIRAGSSNNLFGGSMHKVKKIIIHSGFNMTKEGVPVNDIALVQVTPPFKFGKTRSAIPLFEGVTKSGSNATISGWGTADTVLPPINLQAVNIPTISKEECQEAYKNLTVLPEGQICAALPEGGKDACQGDSGGPMAINGQLAGIVSWGLGCAQKGNPGVYTEVAHHLNWIRNYVNF